MGSNQGVRKRPGKTPGGLDVGSIIYAPVHRKYFAIGKKTYRGMIGSNYVVETLNKTGKFAKRQIRELWDTDFPTASDAKFAIRKWDLA